MEDNEFEEVTIISHTDQGATILPQRTAERLMKDIRLEVTQKISQTENIKMGSLKDSEASTILNKIKQTITQPVSVLNICIARKHQNSSKKWLLGSSSALFLLDTTVGLVQEISVPSHTEEDSSSDEFEAINMSNFVTWYGHHYIFKN